MQYSDYQNQSSSEKVILAILNASKRLMGWTLYSGSVYSIPFTYSILSLIEDSGTPYTAVTSIGAVTASKYFLDKDAKILYLRTTGSDNPNGRFLAATIQLCMANVPIVLPYDLNAGFSTFWEPWIKNSSEFGVTIDTIAQTSEAIEGTGTLTLNNDFDFWPQNFDKLTFENQTCSLYSYNRDLPLSQKRILFKGSVLKHNYSNDTIEFQLQDLFAQLAVNLSLPLITALSGRTDSSLSQAYQRLIFGRVFGHVGANIDQVLDGYPITGTVSINYNTLTVTGAGTAFLSQLSPNDQLTLFGKKYSIATIASDTSLTLSNNYLGKANLSAVATVVTPDQPKRYMNRVFNLCGHVVREPVTTTLVGCDVQTLFVSSTRDIHDGDSIYVGTLGAGEVVTVQRVIGSHYLRLATSLSTSPAAGVTITRPAVQNVRIDDVLLAYYTDYTFNASTGTLTLSNSAEANSGPIFQLSSSATFTNTSRTVTGSGFQDNILPGYQVGVVGNALFFEVLSVDSDTQITLRSPATFNATATGRYKAKIFDPSASVLSLDIMGRTDDGTTSGNLIKTAPSISKSLLTDAGLSASIATASFTSAEDLAYQELGFAIPTNVSDSALPTYRDALNTVNKSVFGTLIQDIDFNFAYEVLRPKKTITATKFSEADILSFAMDTTADNVALTAIVTYQPKEFDYLSRTSTISTSQTSSNIAQYLVKTKVFKTIDTILVNVTDAGIMSARWGFLLQRSAGRLTFTTKLQASSLQIGDVIEVQHRKFFERFGSTGKRKLLLVESIHKSGTGCTVEAADLSNIFNRTATINDFIDTWVTASEDHKLYGGYITDQYGLINNDPISFETNLIW